MKLLIIYHAGLSEDAKNIFREYARQGVDVTVIVPSDKYRLQDNEKTFRFISVKFKAGFMFLPLFYAIKTVKPDVIQVLDEYSSLYLAKTILCRNILYGKKVPVFAYAFQNVPFMSPTFIFEFSLRAFRRLIYKIGYPLIFWYHNNNVNGISGSNKEALLNVKKLNPTICAKLISWGVDTKKFFPKNREACREKLGIQKEVKLLGYFGRMLEEKGLDTLLSATHKTDNYYVMLVGDGDYKDRLVKMADSLGLQSRVFFHESVKHSDLVDFYNVLDVFILPSKTTPSWKEQYGRVLVEAMACGLPVIGSFSGAIPEVLKGYPKGFIFNEQDAENLVMQIKKAEAVRFPDHFNLQDFLYKFSVENFVTEHMKFYQETIHGN